ncbi:hypothetical protein N7456_007887 [Penicillium angulare]|uniref:Uncharacterized protein n=1 Tax=Penicillium angulare TaxID=116970 RepID=A0A9W9FBP5_9EURO|nr:hypothetical protein N7456_007887 [Penicillium angulare]
MKQTTRSTSQVPKATTKPPPTEKIRIGDTEYLIEEIQRIPYFASLIRFHESSRSSIPPHVHIPYLPIITNSIKNGLHTLFENMPSKLKDYRILCETLNFLCVDVAHNRTLQDISHDFQSKKVSRKNKARKNHKHELIARDSAFQLLYLFLQGEFNSDSEINNSDTAYNSTMFIVSHPGLFCAQTRKMVRLAYEDRFYVTVNQLHALNNWDRKNGKLNALSYSNKEWDAIMVEASRYERRFREQTCPRSLGIGWWAISGHFDLWRR